MFNSLLNTFTSLVVSLETVLPLPFFVIIGSVLEELISPIPATLVLGVVGSYIAATTGNIPYLIVLITLATLGKTIAAWMTYWLGRLMGRFVIVKWGRFFGVKIEDIDKTNQKLKKHNAWALTFAMRALPIAPSAAVSIAGGILHLNQKVFLSSTFFGYIIRNGLTALLGYAGIDIFSNWENYSTNPLYAIFTILLLSILAIYWLIKTFK
ncbi:MAG: hypothetical protein UY18_C0007G0003 [Microgenomates group bacterium GW2011_GWF2_47_9]|nr:MAG: hypothetical protein UY18_C0007G0003 [Microgenomates group bacterium GW2011_GWF2_47_9]